MRFGRDFSFKHAHRFAPRSGNLCGIIGAPIADHQHFEFVWPAVVKQRFGKQKGKGSEKMEEAVSELVEADPQFVSRLQSQLKRIAGG